MWNDISLHEHEQKGTIVETEVIFQLSPGFGTVASGPTLSR